MVDAMNQVLKDSVYKKGTIRQVDFMAEVGGMNEEERAIFHLIHEGKTDIYIQQELSLSRKAYARIEESIRAKLLLVVFECINHYMDDYNSI